MSVNSEELLTLKECEAWTKRRVSTWRKDIREGKVPIVRIGRQIRVPLKFIEKLISQGSRPPINME